MELYLQVITAILALAIAVAAMRLALGPSLANRVVALDVVAVLAAALTAVLAIRYEQRLFLDVTIVLALVSFATTVAFAYYIDKQETPRS
jgi:multicomponent Na+:H+ antiporter subunit F